MSRILLRDLEPGRLYHIQARATNGDESSQWSQLWDLETTSDLMPPAAPTSLAWTVEGTAFKAVWTGPITNQDGSPLKDFRDFQVKVYSPAAPGTIITYYTTSARFDFTFESNVNSFGTPRAQVNIEVRARDNTGNLSAAATATATNPPPANVAGLSVVGITNAISLRWDANADDDLKQYEVYQGTTSGVTPNKVYTGLATSFVFDTLSTNPQYFAVRVVDVFNTPSVADATGSATAKSSYAVDTAPPATPTGVTVSSAVDTSDASGGRAYINVSWTGVADTDLQYYSVRYSTNTTDWQYTTVPEGVTATRINGLRPDTAYNVAVAAVDFSGNSSAYVNAGTYPITTAKDTTAPAAPTGVTIGAGVTTITVYWNENSETDVKGGVGFYEIQLDTVNTFNSVNLISKQTSGTITSFSSLTSNTTYYVRIRAVDASGNAGSYSSIVSSVPRYIANGDIQAGTINGDRITAATLAGDRVIANTLDANTIKANSTFSQNVYVGSTFTMASGGIMSSSNYSTGVSGWRLTQTGLEIVDGVIQAKALKLQNGHNVIHPAYADFEFNPTWYTSNLSIFNNGNSTLTWSIATAPEIVARFNTGALKMSRVANSGSYSRVYLAPNSNAYNLPLEPFTTYIFSAYAYAPVGGGTKQVSLTIKDNAGVWNPDPSPGTVTVSGIQTIPEGVWTRISGNFTTNDKTLWMPTLQLHTGGDVYWDGIQIEPKITSETAPSQWKPPGSTSIDGGIIRTGEIRSTALANGLGSQPAWSINVQGNAQFGDALIRGRMVVGDPSNPSADGVNSRIHSANYSAGTTGWIIRNDGYAEFRNIAVNSIKVTAFDSPFQQSSNAKLFDYMQDANLWLTSGSVTQKTDPGAYSAESLFEFTGPGLVLRNGTGVKQIAYDPTILYRVSARIRAYEVAQLNTNGTFESNNTTGWSIDSTPTVAITASNTYSNTGTYSMRINSVATSGAYRTWTNVAVKPGYDYTINAKVKAMIQQAYYNASLGGNISIKVTWFGTSGFISDEEQILSPPVDASGVMLTAPTTWFSISGVFTAPALATNANFIIRFSHNDNIATPATTIAYLDDVSITTPPRVKVGLFGFDNANNIIDYDFVDVATTPTKIRPMPSDYSLLSGYTSGQYMLVANNDEMQIATGGSGTTADWITVTGYIRGRGGSGATGKFGLPDRAPDPYLPSSFNQEVRYMVPYVEFDVASGSKAQLDQFSIEAFENGAPTKVDTTGTSGSKGISIDNIQEIDSEFDHAIRFYTGASDEMKPGMIGHILDGDVNNAAHLRISPPMLNNESTYGRVNMGIYDRNPNYIYDSDFQRGITNWTANTATPGSVVSWDENEGRVEAGSLKITTSGTPISTTEVYGKYDIYTDDHPDLIGQRLTASGWFKASMLKPVRLYVNCHDENGAIILSYYFQKTPTNTTDWVRQAWTMPVVVPDNTSFVRYFWWWNGAAAGESIWVDECQLETGGLSTYRDAQSSTIQLSSDVVRSTGAFISASSELDLPNNVWGGGAKRRDKSVYPAFLVQTDSGSGGIRYVNYTDSNGNRASLQMTNFSPTGTEETAIRLYGMNDDVYPGRFILTNANGQFVMSSYADDGGDMTTSKNVRVYGHLDVDGHPPWTTATLLNGVTNVSGGYDASYYTNNGTVYLRGIVKDWVKGSGTPIFNLPSGFRPQQNIYLGATVYTTTSDAISAVLVVQTGGNVYVYSASASKTVLLLDGISFSIAADVVAPPVTGDTTAPGTVSGFSVNAYSSGSSTGVYQLKWTNPSASDTAGAKIIWRTDRYPTVTIAGSGTKTLTTDGSVITVAGTASQAKSYNHSGIPVNKTIYYRVVAYDKSGNHSTYVSASRYLLASPVAVTANSSGSYRLGYGGMWRNDGDEVYQGDWTGNDNHRGVYMYGTKIYAALSKGGVVRTPTKMTIYLKRLSSSHGNNAGVGINLRGHVYQTIPSGDPIGGMYNEGSDGDNIVYLSRGEAATVTVPSSWYNNFVDSTAANRLEGLGVYGSTTSDYAVMYGKSSGSSYGKVTIYHKG